MKILVLSDSHGRKEKMREIVDMHRGADFVVFLGDGIRDAIDVLEPVQNKVLLLGNCDSPTYMAMGYGTDQILDFDGVKILCTHGHKYGVKFGLGTLNRAAREKECAVAIYGHTHTPLETREDGTVLFNPGSVADGSFGLLYIEKGVVAVSNGNLNI